MLSPSALKLWRQVAQGYLRLIRMPHSLPNPLPSSLESRVSPQRSGGQPERVDDGHALLRQDQESTVGDEQHDSEQSDEESDDMDDITLVVGAMLDNMWNQLSAYYPQRTAEQWKRLYMDRSLPASEAERVLASPATRTGDRAMPVNGVQPTNQSVQRPRAQIPATTGITDERHTIPPAVRRLDPPDDEHAGDALPLREATQTQRLPSQACIQGNMKFTNCGQVNIASNASHLVGRQHTDGGPLLAAGELVFENCNEVNILAPQHATPSILRRPSPSHRTMRRPVQSTREHRRQRSERPEGMQSQVRSQGRPPAPPTPQLAQPNALPQAFGQSHLPTGIPM
jgi:hypothetical protein